jgi:type VI protein secretion system component VasF
MSSTQRVVNVLIWTVVLIIALGISSRWEHELTISIGCRLSPTFAQTIANEEKSLLLERETNPDEMRRVSERMVIARYTVRGIIAFVLAVMIVYYRLLLRRSGSRIVKGVKES